MRTTLNLDETVFKKAAALTGVREKTSLIHLGLQALINQEQHRRLVELGGTEPRLQAVARRRQKAA